MPEPGGSGGPRDLVGRADTLGDLRAFLARAAEGHGGARSLVATAGMGKTVVLDRVAAEADGCGFKVLRHTGSPADADLPWAGLSALCMPARDRFDRLPGPQGRALGVAFALLASDEAPDRLAVSLGALGVLSDLALERPLLVVVDDIQWVDRASRLALDFIAHRLGDDRIALVTAGRPDGVAAPGAIVPLRELDDDATDAVLRDAGVTSATARAEIVATVGGNPLVAVEVARSIGPDERSGSRPLRHPIPAPASIDDLFADRLASLDDRCRRALVVLAALPVDGDGHAAEIESFGVDLDDLEDAERVGLIEFGHDGVAFTHPLARSAVYHGVSTSVRRRVHAELATAVGETTSRGILHRAEAAAGADAALAADLAGLGAEAVARGAFLTAVERFARAAELADTARCTADLLVRAAGAALEGGAARWADELVTRAADVDPERAGRIDARRVEVRLAVAAGRYAAAHSLAVAIDADAAAHDPVGVADVLTEVARTVLPVDPLSVLDLCDRAWELTRGTTTAAALRAEIVYGAAQIVRGDMSGIRHVERWSDLLDLEGPVLAGPFLAETAAMYFSVIGRIDDALAVLDRIEPTLRRLSASAALVPVLATRGHVLYRVDLQGAVAAANRALELADAGGAGGLAPTALHALIMGAAAIGDDALVAQIAARLTTSGTPVDLAYAHLGPARLCLARGRSDDAADLFDSLRRVFGAENLTVCRFEGDEIDALVQVGRLDDARDRLAAVEAYAPTGPWARGQYERSLALLADDIDDAVGHFAAAEAAFRTKGQEVAWGMNELAWGERLRRAKRKAEARRHLESAVDIFTKIGADAFRRLAADALVAAGGTDDRDRPTEQVLAPHELQVARLAVAGGTNRDIAGQLFLSPRTVENHLSAVYRKLGVAGRAQLAARAAVDPALQPTANP